MAEGSYGGFHPKVADLFPRTVCFDGPSLEAVAVTVLENPSGSWAAGNGATVWDCAIALAGYLLAHRCCGRGTHGVELGAGVGLVACALAQGAGAHVVATERPLTLDLLEESCRYSSRRHRHESQYHVQTQVDGGGGGAGGSGGRRSDVDGAGASSSSSDSRSNDSSVGPRDAVHSTEPTPPGDDDGDVVAMPLTWGSADDLVRVVAASPRGVDFVVAADVVFPSNSDCWDALADTLGALLRSSGSGGISGGGGGGGVRCWLTYETRESSVFAAFFDGVLKERGIHYTRLVDSAVVPDDIYLLELTL
jgi:hypothetical protein